MSGAIDVGRIMVGCINETARKIILRHLMPSLRAPMNDNDPPGSAPKRARGMA